MDRQKHLELLAISKAGKCALSLAAECGESDAFTIISGAIKAFTAAAVSLDSDATRSLLTEIGLRHFPIRCVVSNEAQEVKFG